MAALSEDAIFDVARQISSQAARDAYLDQACDGKGDLRARVEELLAADAATDSRLDCPLLEQTAYHPEQMPLERPGHDIGPYKVREQLGEGGMGVVFVAEQRHPIRRKVALKVIKPGMDSQSVVARFEAERQALAMMDHPNIAKVLDAGATEAGRPYFAMELVRGIPITEYCDQNRLTVPERLRLFTDVCHAVQHAHQKGIIHRDIKPSNVLVTLHDGKPVSKVIDFGVAKALNARLTDRTIYTEHFQIVGTLLYMSPEQAELSGLDVDTRSDIYSLGVLLYELLTGTTPFQDDELRDAALDEQRRIIRQQEPPRVSVRISSLGDTATAIAEHRRTDTKKLHQMMRTDLDWITAKAMEKDRVRRYETAREMAGDIDRHLSGHPIEACPPSTLYRARKMATKHRGALLIAATLAGTMISATIVSLWMAREANVARREADVERATTAEKNEQLGNVAFDLATAAALVGHRDLVKRATDTAEKAKGSLPRIETIRALVEMLEGNFDEATRLVENALMHTPPQLREGPSSIGPRAIRANASFYGGKGYAFEDEWEFLVQVQPTSDTDRLLKAIALVSTNPQAGVAALDTPESRNSPIGLLVRAKAGYLLSIDRQDSVLMEKTVTDFEYLQDIFNGGQEVVAWRLETLAAAINFAEREGRTNDVRRHTETGTKIVNELASNFAFACYCRWLFYRSIDEPENALDALSSAGEPRYISWYLAADCLALSESTADANKTFDDAYSNYDHDDAFYRLAQAHLVRDLEGGAGKSRDYLEGLLTHKSGFVVRHALLALCLVDTPEQIKKKALQVLASRKRRGKSTDTLWGGSEIKYLADEITEEQLLEAADENHHYATATAHYAIAMLCLAKGDRSAAKENFAKCVATNTVGCEHYEMSRAYCARLVEDDWPHWLVNRGEKSIQD